MIQSSTMVVEVDRFQMVDGGGNYELLRGLTVRDSLTTREDERRCCRCCGCHQPGRYPGTAAGSAA